MVNSALNMAGGALSIPTKYFIYRSNMSDYFQYSEPMDIEGEAVCAVGPQLITAEGEPGAGVDVNRSFSEKEADTLLLSEEGEPTDDQEQVIASTHEKFAKTAAALMNKANQVSILQGKGAMSPQTDRVGVQDVRGGLDPTDNRAIHNNNDALIEGVRVPGPSLVPYLLAPPAYALWS